MTFINNDRVIEQNHMIEADPPETFGLPEFIEIEPIHNCNLRCVMCHVSYEKMSLTKINPNRFAKKLSVMKGRWAVVGGEYEPMTHPNIDKILTDLSNAGMKLDLTTNGTLFTKKRINELSKLNFKRVTISFDGSSKETFEKIRRGAKFEKTISRIIDFKRAVKQNNSDCNFFINYTVMKDNVDEMTSAVDFWESEGFNHIGFIVMVVRNDNDILNEQSLKSLDGDFKQHFSRSIKKMIDLKYKISISSSANVNNMDFGITGIENHKNGSVFFSHNPHSFFPSSPRNFYQDKNMPQLNGIGCSSAYKGAKILYNGDVQICSQFPIGNINQNVESFSDIWFGKTAQKMRSSLEEDHDICHSCHYFKYCIKAGKIDYEDPENYKFLKTKDPVTVSRILNRTVVNWLDRFYLTRDGYPYDPRFSKGMNIGLNEDDPSLSGFCNALTKYLKSFSAKKLELDSNLLDFWTAENLVFSTPKNSYDGVLFNVSNPEDLRLLSSATEINDILEAFNLQDNNLVAPALAPVLAGAEGKYNIVKYAGKFFGIPQSLGAFEVDKVDIEDMPDIITSDNYNTVVESINHIN